VCDSPVTGLVMASDQIDADVRLMKEAGGNAGRCHYPIDAAFHAARDRLGLRVWIEPPVYRYRAFAAVRGVYRDADRPTLASP
jgi:beta-galactosidase/beta-glucuronidase